MTRVEPVAGADPNGVIERAVSHIRQLYEATQVIAQLVGEDEDDQATFFAGAVQEYLRVHRARLLVELFPAADDVALDPNR
jgi:hypothetical protein